MLWNSRKARPSRAGAKVPKLARPITLRKMQTIRAATGKQQQEADQFLVVGRQHVQRHGQEGAAQRAGVGRGGLGADLLDQEGVVEVADVMAGDHGRLAEGEDEVGGRHLAEVMVDGAHRQPALIDPGLDPVVGALVAALGQRQRR